MNLRSNQSSQQTLRGTDSNSLLRLYDAAQEVCRTSASQLERTRAGKAVERLTKELKRRNIPLSSDAPPRTL